MHGIFYGEQTSTTVHFSLFEFFFSVVLLLTHHRPEAIESVFIMYRITGDSSLQDAAWRMFQSIEKLARTEHAHAGIIDVTTINTGKLDKMESFWLAETLKYFYLIFSEPDVVSLDEYVL
jgi:mannosyl-oligosaccharide alpha-1,2-mannosidase